MSGTQSQMGIGGSAGPVKTIVNYYSSGGAHSANAVGPNETNNCKALSYAPAMTAGTLYKVLDLVGRGRINMLTGYTKDATPRTVRLQLIIDGQATPAFDATTDTISSSGLGLVAVGSMEGSTPSAQTWQPIDYHSSCQVWIASSLSETNKIGVAANYEEWQ